MSKKHKTRKQKKQAKRQARRGRSNTYRATESTQHEPTDTIYLEAKVSAPNGEELTGKQWEVTIIGANDDMSNVINIDGAEYIRSENGRLYATEGLQRDASMWEGAKVYDNHLTPDEYRARMGMRSPVTEWLGSIVNVRWNETKKKLQGIFKVAETAFAEKLKSAWEQGILKTIGLSIDSYPSKKGAVMHEGSQHTVTNGFDKVNSVDVVGNPAAGGAFERILAANTQNYEEPSMDESKELLEEVKGMLESFTSTLDERIRNGVQSTLAEALAADVEDEEPIAEAEEDETEVLEEAEEEPQENEAEKVAREAIAEAREARFELLLARKLDAAKLSENGRGIVESAFSGRIVETAAIDEMIKKVKATEAATDPSGRVTGNGQERGTMQVFDEADKAEIALMQKVMGTGDFRKLEGNDNDLVTERLTEAYNSWKNNGKENIYFNGRLSELLRNNYLNGGWSIEELPYKEASTLATVIKNTVNIMTALDYAGSNKWYEPIVDMEESDNPIDTFTLARLFGADSLDVVTKGAAYTEMQLDDEEETAAHVKQGNYVAIHLEDMLADKIGYIRTIPSRLADAWYNTLSAKVAAVFTLNSDTGPTLSDTGKLFNNTAATSAGGHANLLTTALSFTAYDTAVNAMYNQTARLLGTGRKLVDMENFHLLVPVGLRTTANQIRNSEKEPGVTDNSDNPYYQSLQVVQVPDWTDANNWAILARYRGRSPIKLIFPRGMRTPQIFTADSELGGSMFTNDTLRYKLRMMTYRLSATDDCAPVADWRLLHKSNVA